MFKKSEVLKEIREYFKITEKEAFKLINSEKKQDRLWKAKKVDLTYSDMQYVFIAFSCYFNMSKHYCTNTISFLKHKRFNSILDMGAGIGLTTAHMAEAFSNKEVYYNNLSGAQNDFAQDFFIRHAIPIYSALDLSVVEQADVILCWEFFEHFEKPIEMLQLLLDKKPKYLSFANAFNVDAYGHYKNFIHDGATYERSKIGRVFNNYLREKGYEVAPECLKFWNRRPNIWVKK